MVARILPRENRFGRSIPAHETRNCWCNVGFRTPTAATHWTDVSFRTIGVVIGKEDCIVGRAFPKYDVRPLLPTVEHIKEGGRSSVGFGTRNLGRAVEEIDVFIRIPFPEPQSSISNRLDRRCCARLGASYLDLASPLV